MKVLSLFSGIGGLDLAAEWAGMETVAFCEIDDYACKVLEKRWPGVPIYRDVRELTANRLRQDGIEVDLITGGFPCQDVSCAGKRTGFHDSEGNTTRSGLWAEYARIIGEVKPKWVVAENVRGLLSIPALGRAGGGFGIVLRGLADLGYIVGWCCYGANDVGANHQRDRVFIIANSPGKSGAQPLFAGNGKKAYCRNKSSQFRGENRFFFEMGADAAQSLCRWEAELGESALVRSNDGIRNIVDRSRCLGNAVVPQQAYPIFKAIMEVESCKQS